MTIIVNANQSSGFCVKNITPVRPVPGPPSCFTEASKQATQMKELLVLKAQHLTRVF